MPTFRKDLHLGHEVATTDTDDIVNGAITEEKMADGSVSTRIIQDGAVTEPKLDDGAVSTRIIQDGAVTEPKLADESVSNRTIQPEAVDGSQIKPGSIENKHLAYDSVWTRNIKDKSVLASKLGDDVQASVVFPITDSLDEKYTNITNELYSLIRSLQVGGIAISQQFGDRTDIGISQKTLTKALGRFWQEMETITHKTYMDFTLTVTPAVTYKEGPATVAIKADCSGSISNFDSIKIYIDDVLVTESSDIEVFTTSQEINQTSTVKAVGVILGKTITKTQQVIKEIPFFMGGGMNYQDIMTMEYHKELEGTLEGDYDLVVKQDGYHLFIIIPASRKSEFRRVNMKTPDMNGFEIPIDLFFENEDYVVYKSKAESGYLEDTYNVDININS